MISSGMLITPETLPVIARICETIPGGFFVYHAYGDQELIGFNSQMLRIYGCSTDEEFRQLTGNSFRGLVHPDEYEAVEQDIRNQIVHSNEGMDHVQYHFLRKDGTMGMIDDYGHFVHSEVFGDVYYVFVQDISERVEYQLYERLRDNYFGLYFVDLDTGQAKIIRSGHQDLTGPLGTERPYAELIQSIARASHGEVQLPAQVDTIDFLQHISDIDYLRERFMDEEMAYYVYKSYIFSDNRWVSSTGRVISRHRDGTPKGFVLGFSLLDARASEREERLYRQKEILREVQLTNTLVRNMAEAYNIVFIADLAADTVQFVRMEVPQPERWTAYRSFSLMRSFFVAELIHPRDRERMKRELSLEGMRQHLAEAPSYSMDFTLLQDGVTKWCDMTITSVGEDKVAIGLAERDMEIAKRLLEDKHYGEYIALYVVDIDTGRIRAIKTSPLYGNIKEGEAADYATLMMRFAEIQEGRTRTFFEWLAGLDNVRQDLAQDNLRTYSYKPNYLIHDKWVEVTTYVIQRNDDGTPGLFTIGFSLADALASSRKELLDRMNEDMQMIGGLADEYYALYYYNFETEVFTVYALDEERFPQAAKIVHAGGDPFDILLRFGHSPMVHPDDRKYFDKLSPESLRERLLHSKKYTVRFRRMFDGQWLWTDMDFIKYEDYDEPAKGVAIGYAERDDAIRSEMTVKSCFDVLDMGINPDLAVDKILSIIADYYGADRAYIFEMSSKGDLINNTYEWCAQGVEAEKDLLQNVPIETVEGWIHEFRIHGAFAMNALDNEHNSPEARALLEMQGIQALVAAPIRTGSKIEGFVGVDNPSKSTTQFRVLQSIATVLHSIILRRKENDEEHVTLKKLADTFLSIYYVDLAIDYMHNWKIDDYGEKIYGGVTKYSESMEFYIRTDIAERDRERCQVVTNPEYIKQRFASCDRFSINMTDIRFGDERDYLFDFIKVSDDGSKCVITSTDVTESMAQERARQQQLAEALAMAESASKAKTTFLNNMSHDIRTPMNAIIGFTGLAASHIDNKDLVQNYLTKIGQSSNHLLSLINDVLDMSRIESGKMNLDEKEEHLPDIIHTLKDIIQADIHAKQHDFFIDTVNVHDEDVVCDKLRLNQVLLNILSNAVKYTAPGGIISLRITETTKKDSGYATYEFCVKDNGIGMSEEFLATIFDPFTRVKSSTMSGIQGTGLGMAITKNIVDMMGGKIDIQSQLGKGTEITVSLDLRLHEKSREPINLESLQGLRGLVVDDDANTCISIANMLREIGMRDEWCTMGKEAVIRAGEAFRRGDSFKVFIIDWLMPDMNGIETTRRIRKVIGDDIPIIILTAYDWSDIEEEAREAGVTAFVSKPMFPSDLHQALVKCLRSDDATVAETEDVPFSLQGSKLLLVEDNELNREIATMLLEEMGATVTSVPDGDMAVETMRQAKTDDFDLILMDIQMPTIDGYEATCQIRALEASLGASLSSRHPRIPIVAMTANAFDEDRKAAIEAGMDEHVAKPIDLPQLTATLAKFLG